MGLFDRLLSPRVALSDHQAALAAAESRASEATARAEKVEEYLRVIANSPMLGAPMPGMRPPSGLPYAYDKPITFATPQPPTRHPGSFVNVETLRRLADTYDVLRSCIQHLKREVASVPIRIVAREEDDDSDGTKKRVREAEEFFSTPGGLGGPGRRRSQFEAAWIDDLLVVGALCFFFRNARGGKLFEVEVIDSAIIRPRVDAFGWPGPGEKVYEQWVYGVLVEGYTREEMCYDGINASSYSPYFKSPVEWILGPAMTALKADEWNRTWLTDGTSPSEMIALPEDWKPDQVKEYVEMWNAMYEGDSKARQKVKFVPSGTSRVGNPTRKDQDFQLFELWLLRRCCSMFGVQPASIGYVGEQYKVSQDASMDQTSTFGAGEILEVRKARYDDILARLGHPDLEVQNVTDQEEAADARADRLTKLLGGVLTPNEARQAEGREPIEGGDELFIPATYTPVTLALQPPPDPAENASGTGAPASSSGAAPSSATSSGEKARRALLLWEKKALNRLTSGKKAACSFGTEDLPESVQRHLGATLASCETAAMVRSAFSREARALAIGNRWRDRRERDEATYGKREIEEHAKAEV